MAPITKGLYYIQVVDGTPRGRFFLSAKTDGGVDLWGNDDGSGRQRWNVEPFDSSKGEQCFHIKAAGGVGACETFLGSSEDGRAVHLTQSDTTTGREKWVLEEAVKGPDGFFYIKVLKGTPKDRQFLSVNPEGTWVDLYGKDDETGRQRWRLVPVPPLLVKLYFLPIHGHDGSTHGKMTVTSKNICEGHMSHEMERFASAKISASGIPIPFLDAGLKAQIKEKASSSLTTKDTIEVKIELNLEEGKPLYFYQVQVVILDPTSNQKIVRASGTLSRGESLQMLELPL